MHTLDNARKCSFLFLAVLLFPLALSAQDAEMPDAGPPPEVHKLYKFIGHWMGNGEVVMGTNTHAAEVHLHVEKAAGGWGLRSTMHADLGDMGEVDEIDIMGYEPNAKTYHMFSVTSMGETHDHAGTWSDESTLTLTYDGMAGPQTLHESIRIHFLAANKMEIRSETTVGGKRASLFTATLVKH